MRPASRASTMFLSAGPPLPPPNPAIPATVPGPAAPDTPATMAQVATLFSPSGPTLFDALQQQLGLKLVPAEQALARLFVIDRVAQRPTEN